MLLARGIPFRFIYWSVVTDVVRVLLFSVAFHMLKLFFVEHLPPIPPALPTILGTALSLLLAFNLNQSYDRWWEARKIWGAIVNDSRSFVLQVLAFVRPDRQAEAQVAALVRRMARRQIVWCYTLGRSLRDQHPLASEEASILEAAEREAVARHANQPLALLHGHMQDLRTLHQQGLVNDFQQIQIDSTIVRLCASMGKAERIKKTVFPVTYRIFIHFFVYLFLVVLSLALVEAVGFLEIPILVVVASTFFLIESTARQMQDPFENKPSDTAMTAIARTIDINIRQLIGEEEVPEPYPADGFYLL